VAVEAHRVTTQWDDCLTWNFSPDEGVIYWLQQTGRL